MDVLDILPKLDKYQREVWVPETETDAVAGQAESGFFIDAFLDSEESWPLCKACQTPMPVWLQLNVADLPPPWAGIWGGRGYLQHFLCCSEDCIADSHDV